MFKVVYRILIQTSILLFLFSCREQRKEENPAVEKTATPVEALTEKIQNDPGNASLYYQRSKWNLSVKRMGAAEADIRKALSIDSSKADYYILLADISFAGFHIPNAKDAFKKSLALNPDNIDAYLKLAELNLYMKEYEESIKNANEALRLDKRRGKAYFIKGFVYKETRDTLRAISNFQTCVEQDPAYYDAIIQLGNLYATHYDPIALEYYNSALKLKPHSVEALYNRGLYYQNTGSLEKAEKDYNEILKLDPTHGFAYFNLGYIAMRYEKDYKKAIPLFSNALAHENHYVEAYYNRGFCHERIGDIQKAKADYNEALNIYPTYDLAKKALKRL
jgi:tetratricopeptide (TPR) repeat protein